MRRIPFGFVLALTLVFSTALPASAGHGPAFGGLEVEGNTADDSGPGDPIDWATPPADLTTLTDPTGGGDNIFTGTSLQNSPGAWICGTGTTPANRDLAGGAISFRTINGESFVMFNFSRLSGTGDPFIDVEFNQSNNNNPSCPDVAARTHGDALLTFELVGNPKQVQLRAFVWQGNATSGNWSRVFLSGAATRGILWDGAISGDLRFGEGVISLSKTLPGLFSCGRYASAYLKSRTAVGVESQLKDHTRSQPVDLGDCPDTELHKAVRNHSAGESFNPDVTSDAGAEDPTSTSASPEDLIEYRLVVHNHGDGADSNVVVSEEVPDRSTVVSCGGDAQPDGGCPVGAGAGTPMSWTLATVPAGSATVLTFRVQLDPVFPAGDTVIRNVASISSLGGPSGRGSNETTVVVGAAPAFSVDKDPSATLVNAGDTITYTVTVENTGNAVGATPVVDDYDQSKISVSNISAGGTDDGDRITWSSGSLTPGDPPATFTYEATFDGAFLSTDPQGDCDEGQFAVVNVVSVDGDEDSAEVCVIAQPALTLAKSTDDDHVDPGDLLTFTIAYGNGGSGPAYDVVVTDQIPEGATFDSCTGGCTEAGGVATWNIGTVEAGAPGAVTVTVSIDEDAPCQICNLAHIVASNHGAVVSNGGDPLCVDATPQPNPEAANASGSALGAHVSVSALSIDQDIAPVQSSQSGVGSSDDGDQVFSVAVPPADGSVLRANVITTTSTSTVSEAPAQARQLSVAETASVNIANGLVRADLVRAVTDATATGDGSSISSLGSTFKNLIVNGVAVNDVTPNTRINLPALTFGAGSYVALYERSGGTTGPAAGQTSGGTYTADLSVTMIRVHITGLLGLTAKDVIVSQAVAHADFPQTRLCAVSPDRSVSGHAFIASLGTDPSEPLPLMVGYVGIPASGGHDHQNYDEVAVPEDGSGVTGWAAVTDSLGVITGGDASATSVAQIADVCVMASGGTCLVSADLVLSRSNSAADPLGAASDDGDTTLVNVVVNGTPVGASPGPNELIEIPGVGFVILNEQFCDNGASLASSCSDGTGHAGLTVRAVRLVLTTPVAIEVIVAEAHSDATYRP